MDIDLNLLTKKQLITLVEQLNESKNVTEVVTYVRALKWIIPKNLFYNYCSNMGEREFKAAVLQAINEKLLDVTTQNGVSGLSPIGHKK